MGYEISEKLASMKPSAIREIFKSLTDPRIIAFAAGNPAAESFPAQSLASISAEIFATDAAKALQYGITEGYPGLLSAIKDRLCKKFGCSEDGNSFMIVSGGQQGIELTCKVMCNEGDVVLCENPSFIGALNAFRSNGARTVGVELDADGINIESLEKAVRDNPRAKMLYLIPTFHNPAGICTSLEKRRKIYEIAKKNSLVILEDNPYGELRFAGEEIPTIKSMDTDGIIKYGPVWDYDISCGTCNYGMGLQLSTGFVCIDSSKRYVDDYAWLDRLMEDPWFRNRMSERYYELRGTVFSEENIQGIIDGAYLTVLEAATRNGKRWPELYDGHSEIWPNAYKYRSYTQAVNHLKTWLHERVEWLDDNMKGII